MLNIFIASVLLRSLLVVRIRSGLKSLQVIYVAFESLTLNGKRQAVVVVLESFWINDRSDNLLLEGVDDLVLGTNDGFLRGDLLVAEVVRHSGVKNFLEVDQTLLSHEDVVALEEVGYIELLRVLNTDIHQVSGSQ